MVSSPGAFPPSDQDLKHAFLSAQPAVRPPLPEWRPRDGRNDKYLLWLDALISLENDLDIFVEAERPSIEQLVDINSTTAGCNLTEQEAQYLLQRALLSYDRGNVLLYEIIKPSLVLDGPHLASDLRKIASFVDGPRKDGRALRAWALGFADMASIHDQTSLRAALAGMRLQPGADCDRLEAHCRTFSAKWSLIAGNDVDVASGREVFYMQLLSSLPTTPEGAHLTHVRKWLADLMTQSSPVLADVDGAIDAMLKYAKVIGLKSKGVFGLETADRPNPTDPRDLFVLRDRDRAPNENNCSFCNAFWCRSSEHGGPDACVCRWDSKIDLEGGKLEPLGPARPLGGGPYVHS